MGLFADKEDENFARELARDVGRRVPPAVLAAQRGATGGFERTLARTYQHVTTATAEYHRKKRVGILSRVRLSRVFQAELDALGYEDEFIRDLTLRLAQAFAVK